MMIINKQKACVEEETENLTKEVKGKEYLIIMET